MDPDDDQRLERLEADLAAVASAMEAVDRISAGAAAPSGDGDDAIGPAVEGAGSRAAQISAVVSADRFPIPGD